MTDVSFFVQHNRAAILIEGVAGSGKSTALAKQMALLRDETGKRLMLAFSRTGADVLRQYTADLGLFSDKKNKISTIDALALETLHELGDERPILSSNEVIERILPDLVEEVCESLYEIDFYAPQLSDQDMWLLLEDFDYFRATMAFRADSIEEQTDICGDRLNFDVRLVARCFKRYEDLRWTWYSHNDVNLSGYREREGFRRLSEAVSDLYHHEYFETSKALRGYRFVFIDEFHDVSPLQLDFIQRLIKPGCFVMAVGDRYQNVFAWRGADTEVVFNRFIEHFRASVVEQNYSHRFDKVIADLASKASSKQIEAKEKPQIEIDHRSKNQFPELLNKPRKRVALIVQNQLQLMKSAWQIWMHTRGAYRISYNLSQLYVVSLVNVLYALKTAQFPLLAGVSTDAGNRISLSSAKTAFSYDLKRFYQGDYCFLSAEAKDEVIKSANAKSFQNYAFMHLSNKQGTPVFSESMIMALRGILKSDMEAPLAPLLAKFAEQANLFSVIESAGLASAYHYTSWRILLKILHSLEMTFERWPDISQSLYKSWNDRSGLDCLTVAQAKGKEFDFVVLYAADEESFLPRKVGEESARNEYYVGLTRVKRHLQFWESYF